MKLTRLLVPLAGTAIDGEVIEYAALLAKPVKAKVTAIHVIEVRWNLPLDSVLDAALERGEEILAAAEETAHKHGLHLETEILQAREAAAAIVDTAAENKCELILIGMPYRKRLGRVYVGRTVETVYVKAPCAVLAYRQSEPS